MTMATLFSLVLKRKISLRDRLILQEAMNQNTMEGIVRLIRKVLIFSLVIEGCGAVLFAIRLSFDMPVGRAVYFGIFHGVSMFNNAGFDLFGHFNSLTGYVYDPLVNIVVMFLIVSGGIGFIVMSDLVDYRHKRKLSLHTKIVLSMTGALILVGAIVIFVFEFTNPKTLGSLNWGGKILASFFQSVSPRPRGQHAGSRKHAASVPIFHGHPDVYRRIAGIHRRRDQNDHLHHSGRRGHRHDPRTRRYRALPLPPGAGPHL